MGGPGVALGCSRGSPRRSRAALGGSRRGPRSSAGLPSLFLRSPSFKIVAFLELCNIARYPSLGPLEGLPEIPTAPPASGLWTPRPPGEGAQGVLRPPREPTGSFQGVPGFPEMLPARGSPASKYLRFLNSTKSSDTLPQGPSRAPRDPNGSPGARPLDSSGHLGKELQGARAALGAYRVVKGCLPEAPQVLPRGYHHALTTLM